LLKIGMMNLSATDVTISLLLRKPLIMGPGKKIYIIES
jgi:hypothetical protein